MASTQNQAPHGEPRSVGVAYLLWVPSLLGVAGLHRFYTGRWGSGLLWLFTGGLCYVGSVVDLFLIPEQVRSFNRSALEPGQPSDHEPMTLSQSILVLARRRGTRGFTFNDAVLELGHPPEAIRPALESLMQEDCLHVINDLEGRIVYREP
ncbi:MAG: TM2 domain-containing protein [Cyanobacteria bacterium MAG CAR3_bin_5]|nr:TM2 domain-containing protein [Cyanobacteria bacterium MAG CAR3_bin_5]